MNNNEHNNEHNNESIKFEPIHIKWVNMLKDDMRVRVGENAVLDFDWLLRNLGCIHLAEQNLIIGEVGDDVILRSYCHVANFRMQQHCFQVDNKRILKFVATSCDILTKAQFQNKQIQEKEARLCERIAELEEKVKAAAEKEKEDELKHQKALESAYKDIRAAKWMIKALERNQKIADSQIASRDREIVELERKVQAGPDLTSESEVNVAVIAIPEAAGPAFMEHLAEQLGFQTDADNTIAFSSFLPEHVRARVEPMIAAAISVSAAASSQ